MDLKLTFFEKLYIFFFGAKVIGERWRKGQAYFVRLYAFKCPAHGYVMTHERSRGLKCPKCWGYEETERKNYNDRIRPLS